MTSDRPSRSAPAAPGIREIAETPLAVRARLLAPGVAVELCDFPVVRGEETVIAEDQPILSLGLSPLLPGSSGRYRPDVTRRFASFGPLHLRPAGVPLQFRYAAGAFRSVRCRFEPEYFARLSGLADWSPAQLETCLDVRLPRVEDALLRLADECAAPGPDSADLAAALASVILIDLGRYFRAARGRAETRTGGLPPGLLRRVSEHVERAAAPPTVEELAELCGVSRGHFIRSFRQSTGTTPAKYVEAARISRAKALLMQGEAPIAGVAAELGFSSPSAFCKTFRRAVGRSPSDYRAHMR